MNKIWCHILVLIAVISAAFSCSHKSASVEVGPDGVPSLLTLRISTNGSSATKSIVETDEDGSGYENYIDVADHLAVLFFDTADKFMFQFTPSEVIPSDAGKYPQEWILRGPVNDPPTTGFKVVILANWPGSPSGLEAGKTTIEDVCKSDWAMYSYTGTSDSPFVPSGTSLIPMYGVKTFANALTFRENIATDLGQIDLLRAMSKVVVKVSSAVEEKLSYVKLKKYNPDGACAPLDMYENTGNWKFDHSVHLYGGASDNDSADGDLTFTSSTDGKTWTIYVPEYRNKDDEGDKRSDCSSIELKFDGIDKTYTLDFRDYSLGTDNGKRFNLLRNHIYSYTINSIGSYELSLNLVAQPWDVSVYDYDYKKTVSVSQPIVWTDENHTLVDKRVIAKTAGDLTCTFTIDTPLGATWYAIYEEKKGDLNHFKFQWEDGTKHDYATGSVDGNAVTLNIVQDPTTTGSAKMVIYASYGNVNLSTSDVLGGPYVLVKD